METVLVFVGAVAAITVYMLALLAAAAVALGGLAVVGAAVVGALTRRPME